MTVPSRLESNSRARRPRSASRNVLSPPESSLEGEVRHGGSGLGFSHAPDQARRTLRRGVVILPSAFTLGNLFFGLYALVAGVRGDFALAAWFVVVAATLDMLDGRVARFTRTGSTFGAQLDSLTDAVSFGVAPAVVMIQLHFSESDWGWVIGFVYLAAVIGRLARFTVEQGGEAKRQYHGLPSPTAAIVLATHYPFSQTPFFQEHLAALPWPEIVASTMALLSVLMLSHVPYAMVPRFDLRTGKGRATAGIMAAGALLALSAARHVFYPGAVAYTLWGLLRSAFMGLLERLPERDPLMDDPSEVAALETREVDYQELSPGDRETSQGQVRDPQRKRRR